jgi:hypothetical protein
MRYDRSLNGTHPFNAQRDIDMLLFSSDIIVTF